jgi:hypothetical protein
MKKGLFLLLALLLLIQPVAAQGGEVTYSGDSGSFIFAPGSDYSPTDLFAGLKDLMPGDTITQRITVRNNASDRVKVDIYLKAESVHPEGADFLSQLHLTVAKDYGLGDYMFDAAADQTAQLTDWVLLGTLYSGGEVDLQVTLQVPKELGNEYQDAMGAIDWTFKVEEFPSELVDPVTPETADPAQLWLLYTGVGVSTAALITLLPLYCRKRKNQE